MKPNYRSTLIFSLAAIVLLAVLILCLPAHPLADESVHFPQAQMFARGDWAIHRSLAT